MCVILTSFNTPLYSEIGRTNLCQASRCTGRPGLGIGNGKSRSSVLQVLHFHCKEINGDTFLLPSIFFSFLLFQIYWGLFSNKVPRHALSSLSCNVTVCRNLQYTVHFMLDTWSLLSLLLSNMFCPVSRSAFL